MSEPVNDIVIVALVAELKRARNRLDGAEKRLLFAASQVETETGLVMQYNDEVDLLQKAIIDHGGVVPPEEVPGAAPNTATPLAKTLPDDPGGGPSPLLTPV